MGALTDMAAMFEDHGNAAECAMVKAEMDAEYETLVQAEALVVPDDDTVIPTEVPADLAKVMGALTNGGRAEITVRSKKSGEHVYVTLTCKQRKPDGKGFVSRATAAGRVGIQDAHIVDCTDPNREFPDNRIGTYATKSGKFNPRAEADPKRVWAADFLLRWVRGEIDITGCADIFIATRCCRCGRKLTHPESVVGLIGPECRNHANEGKHAAYAGAVA